MLLNILTLNLEEFWSILLFVNFVNRVISMFYELIVIHKIIQLYILFI